MNRIIRIAWRLGAVLVFSSLAAGGWWMWSKVNDTQPTARYVTDVVTTGPVAQTITANGTVNPVTLVSVGTHVSGTVKKLSADFNDVVKAGQVLLELDPTTFRAAVAQSEGQVMSATASLKLAQANEGRLRELFAQEYVSREELDQSVQAREAAEAQLQVARGQLARDRANLGYSVIRSPVSGVVVSREVDIGQTVAASFQTPTLFKIAQDLTQMQIDTNVAEADIGKVRVDQPVSFTVDAFPGQTFEGRVRQIRLNPITQQNVVTYNVVVSVANPERVLMPGMTAYISITVDRRDNAQLVPNAALRFKPKEDQRNKPAGAAAAPARARGQTVYLLRGRQLVPAVVQTGITDGRRTEVVGGELRAGDEVVVESAGADQKPGQQPNAMRFRIF
ncbi:MAG: efflux RND transporter periplasmic adaptor subunit [Burkholderiales bacterium]